MARAIGKGDEAESHYCTRHRSPLRFRHIEDSYARVYTKGKLTNSGRLTEKGDYVDRICPAGSLWEVK
jgi:hypothetical protein